VKLVEQEYVMKILLMRLVLFGLSVSMLYCSQKLQSGERGCRSDGDCEGSNTGLPACGMGDDCLNVGCEGCNNFLCKTDADCPVGSKKCMLCEKSGIGVCSSGCSNDLECGQGYVCADQRCVPMPCNDDSACPKNFGCESEGCLRTTCTKDDDCTGYCVGGLCVKQLGICFTYD
jgi:hypothetical protein